MTDVNVIQVLMSRVAEAENALNKLNKKAARYNTTPITWELSEPYDAKRWTRVCGRDKTIIVKVCDITLNTIEAPKVGNFQFIASIESTDGGNIIDCVPGESLPEKYRNADNKLCEHCGIRRYRKNMFIVRDENGALKQVGRSCLRDYMGTDTPASVINSFYSLREIRDLEERLGGGTVEDSALALLAVTATAIRLWGWVPKSAPESAGCPTVYAIEPYFSIGGGKEAQKVREKLDNSITDADFEMAEQVMAWIADAELSGTNDYIYNLRVILSTGTVEFKRRAYVASAVASYQRYVGKLAEFKKEQENKKESNWVGQVGERLKGLSLTVKSSRGMESRFGVTILYKMEDENGNLFAWFSSGGKELEVNETYTLDATVKNHNEFKGIKETQITRGKVL